MGLFRTDASGSVRLRVATTSARVARASRFGDSVHCSPAMVPVAMCTRHPCFVKGLAVGGRMCLRNVRCRSRRRGFLRAGSVR
jgi:hypothetical protein